MPPGSLYLPGVRGEKRKEVEECNYSLFSPFPPEMYSRPDGVVVVSALLLFPGMDRAGANLRKMQWIAGRCDGREGVTARVDWMLEGDWLVWDYLYLLDIALLPAET